MSYAVAADVQYEFKSINFAATDASISTAKVTEFIVQEEAMLEARISGVYTTPITGTKSISIMKMLTIMMVKARIEDILAVKVGAPKPEQGNNGDAIRASVTRYVEDIVSRKMQLVDATLGNSNAGVQSYVSENVATVESTFKSGEDQW